MGKYYVCQICGHIEFGSAPASCPVCHSPQNQFKEDADALMPSEKEGKEKHIPQIIVSKECGLIPDACQDVHVKIGSVPHPMQEDHWIQWIDIYVNKVYSARYQLLPANLQAAVSLHLKSSVSGTLTTIEHCNKHGSWMAEAAL
jgi:superoxide reductase